MKFALLLSALVPMGAEECRAQDLVQYGMMPTVDHAARITERFGYNAYVFDAYILDRKEDEGEQGGSRSFMISAEVGATYRINDHLTATAAYLHQWMEPTLPAYRSEDRAYQQLLLNLPLGRTELRQRLRLEERAVRQMEQRTTSHSQRIRYRIGAKMPFGERGWYGMVQTELFFNTVEDLAFRIEENWSSAQVGHSFTTANAIEFGPLYVGWIRNPQKDLLHQWYLQLTWINRIDVRHKRNRNSSS